MDNQVIKRFDDWLYVRPRKVDNFLTWEAGTRKCLAVWLENQQMIHWLAKKLLIDFLLTD